MTVFSGNVAFPQGDLDLKRSRRHVTQNCLSFCFCSLRGLVKPLSFLKSTALSNMFCSFVLEFMLQWRTPQSTCMEFRIWDFDLLHYRNMGSVCKIAICIWDQIENSTKCYRLGGLDLFLASIFSLVQKESQLATYVQTASLIPNYKTLVFKGLALVLRNWAQLFNYVCTRESSQP